MFQEVYADILFLINFSMDYLCLYICARIMKRKMRLFKMLISSSIGGIYSVASIFFNMSAPISLLLDVAICVIMCAIVFSEKGRSAKSTLLCSFLYLGISMMTGGCMTAIFNLLNRINIPLDKVEDDGISAYLFAALAVIAGIISLRSGEVISRRAPIKECFLTIKHGDKEACFLGFVDSGNLVRDPISGKLVIVVDRKKLGEIADISIFDRYIQGHIPRDKLYSKLRLIPINSASGKSILAAFPPDKLTLESNVESKRKSFSVEIDALIAPSDIGSSAEGYNAVIPAEILKF